MTDERYTWGVAFWFWQTDVITKPDYKTKFGVSTRALNGGLECSEDSAAAKKRYSNYRAVAAALQLQPIGEDGCYST